MSLVLLVAPDEDTVSSWNVIVGAPSFDEKSIGDAVEEVADSLRSRLKKSLWPIVARVTTLRTNDPFFLGLRRDFPSLTPGATLHGVRVSGIDIPRAIVIESKKKRRRAA
ncbi:MAG TPA: hypothetical protein VMU84_04365 [Thermoanaerobaculia bacterium]|nr:hypothetical protein [Thermoanaerobaculia bacterium]